MWTQHISPITIKAKSVAFLHLLALLAFVLRPAIIQAASDIASWGPPVVVDAGWGSVGEYASMAIVNGNPAISYYDDTNYDLKYVRATDPSGSTWAAPITIDSAGIVGGYTSLVMVDGNPAISYLDSTNGDLKYVRATDSNGTAWGTPIAVDSTGDVGGATSLTVVNGNPAISYYDFTNRNIKYIRAADNSGMTWGMSVVVDSGLSAPWTTSLTTVNGNPAIGYSADYPKYVRAADASGALWGTPITVDTTGLVEFLSLAIINGTPTMSYNTNSGELKYVHAIDANGTSWDRAIVLESMGSVGGRYNHLAVVNGNPAISYRDSNEESLKYIRATDTTGTTWVAPILVDSAQGRGTHLMVINGNPAISTFESSNGDLKYGRAEDSTGSAWPVLRTVDQGAGSGGMYNSLAVVNGNPAIGYFDERRSGDINGDLKYVRATNVSGTAWGTPITVDSQGDVGHYPSLAVVAGTPAMSYSAGTNADLKYIRATDADGNSWGAPTIVDDLGSGASSLAVVNGNPGISYSTSAGLMYVHATDVNGGTWAPPVIVDSLGGENPSMVLVDGRPAISYFRSELRLSESKIYYELKYVHATDANGISWSPPITLDTITVGLWSRGGLGGNRLAVVNGVPAISYYYNNDNKSGSLKYVRATDATGTVWASPIVVDNMGNIGNTSLAVIQSNPAISYYDGANGDLRYVRAIDQVGTDWSVPEILDRGKSYGGASTSLAIVNGQPAISYHGSLRYITTNDVVPITDLWATNSGPTQLGNATLLTATISAGTDVTYQWDFGDGQSGSGATTTHTYAVAGAYTAIVAATNSLGYATAATAVTITGCDDDDCIFAATSSTDDAGPNPDSGCSYGATWNEVYFGECFDGRPMTSGFRFPNIAIPPGTRIAQAYLEFAVDGTYSNELTLALHGEATGNAQPFTLASPPDRRSLTAEAVPWLIPTTEVWELGETRRSTEVTTIVQAIVNRPDWAEGNALALMVSNVGPANSLHRRVIGYDRLMSFPARLVIIKSHEPTNLLVNGDFEVGSQGWLFDARGQASFTTVGPAFAGNAAMRIDIGKIKCCVQLEQTSFRLEPHTRYRLQFAAKSSSGRDLAVYLYAGSNHHTNYGLRNFRVNLAETWKNFTIEFTTKRFATPTSDTGLRFWLAAWAKAGDVYWLDEVSLVKITPTVAVAATLAQGTGSVNGRLQGVNTPMMIHLVDLESEGAVYQVQTVTDAAGNFRLIDVPYGVYELSATSLPGYLTPEAVQLAVSEDPNEEIVMMVTLTTNSIYLPLITR